MMKVLDLFCGCGGFSIGFRKIGFEIVCAIDLAEHCEKTYKRNFPNTIFIRKDISTVSSKELKKYGPFDVVIGSPPCEGFTLASVNIKKNPIDRLYLDDRGRLTLEYIRIVANLRPRIFVMENVPQIAEKPIRYFIEKEFEEAGYEKIYFNIIKCERHGCPSKRTRVFVSNIPLPLEKEEPKTVEETIGNLPDPRWPNEFYNHSYVPVSKKKERQFSKLQWGKYLRKYKDFKGRDLQVMERLYPDRICPSIKGHSRFIHPFDDRLLTVREQARLMSYPDDHVFLGSKDEQFDMIGESVPPIVSEKIAKVVQEHLQ